MKIHLHMKDVLYTAVKTLIGMKIHLYMKNILYTALKTLIGMKICLCMKICLRCKNALIHMKCVSI